MVEDLGERKIARYFYRKNSTNLLRLSTFLFVGPRQHSLGKKIVTTSCDLDIKDRNLSDPQ